MYSKVNKTWRVVLVVLVLLVCFRLALPYIITRYVNSVINQLDGYRGSAHDVDVHLFTSTYTIDTIRIYRNNADKNRPLAEIPMTEITIDWPSVFKGNFGSEVIFHEPHLRISDHGSGYTSTRTDWLATTGKLSPLAISRIRINGGQITYRDSTTQITLLQNVQMDALNLNANEMDNSKDELPSRVYVQALSIGNGQLNVAVKLNLASNFPQMDMDVRFEKVKMEALNKLLGRKMAISIENGSFNLFGEISSFEGNITGFLKPIFTDLTIGSQQDRIEQVEGLWVSFASLIQEAALQQRNNQFATRVIIDGDVQSSDSPFLPALWNIFSNALIATASEIDDPSDERRTASTTSEKTETITEEPKSKKEERRERRREKREERKKQKREKKEGLSEN